MQAYAYIRFSSKRQEMGDSVKRQLEAAQKWCQHNNAELSKMTFEDLGISAFKEGGKRPALADLIECVRAGVIPPNSAILFENTDRLTRRGFAHALSLLQTLIGLNVKLVIISTGQVFDQSNIHQLTTTLPLLLDADRAHLESERKSELIKSAKRRKREMRQLPDRLVFWLDKKDGKAVLNDMAPTMRRIIDMRLQDEGFKNIARILNAENVKGINGRAWAASTISNAIASRAMYGAIEYGEMQGNKRVAVEIVDDILPAIATKQEWERCQAKRRHGVGTVTRASAFSELVKCSTCGGALQVKGTVINGKKYVYRKCIHAQTNRCSNTTSFKLVDEMLTEILKHVEYIDLSEHANNHFQKIADLEAKLTQLNESKQFIKNPKALAMMYDDIYATEEQLESLKQINVSSVNTKKLFELPTKHAQNIELKKIVDKIVLYGKKNVRVQIIFKNKHKINALVKCGSNKFDIMMISDSKKLQEFTSKALDEECAKH